MSSTACRRRRGSKKGRLDDTKEREQETIRLINKALEGTPDLVALRKIASVRGLVNSSLRRRCWPLLLGASQHLISTASRPPSQQPAPPICCGQGDDYVFVTPPPSPAHSPPASCCSSTPHATSAGHHTSTHSSTRSRAPTPPTSDRRRTGSSPPRPATSSASPGADQGGRRCERCGRAGLSWDAYASLADEPHRDSSVVEVDVQRSLWSFTAGCSDEELQQRRRQLKRLINATINFHSGEVFYYQGLHDVAGVLLLVLGEAAAFPALSRLALTHLRDATRPALDAVVELLGFLYPILEAHDRTLVTSLRKHNLPPYFALSWCLTWFAHDTKSLQDVCRLFDVFLSSPPLMPLYLGAVAMSTARQQLLQCSDMPELHTSLVNLDICKALPLDDLVVAAISLIKAAPPRSLLAHTDVRHTTCVGPHAELKDGLWWVPDKVVARGKRWGLRRDGPLAVVQFVLQLKGPRQGGSALGTKRKPAALMGAMLSLTVGMTLVLALVSYSMHRLHGPSNTLAAIP